MTPADFDISQMMFQLFDHAAESMAVVDNEGRVLFVNRIAGVYTGKTAEEVMGRLIWEAYPEIGGLAFEEQFRRVLREQIPISIEFYYSPGDKWFGIRFYPSPNSVAVFFADITVSKKAAESVRQSEEKYRRLIDTVDQGFCLCEIVWDKEGRGIDHRFLEVNPAFEGMTGLVDATGKLASEVIPGLENWFNETYSRMLKTGNSVRFQHEAEVMGKIFDVFASPISNDRFVLLFTDITGAVRRDQENDALNRRLRRSMAETHHRVKNNLQVIASLVEMQVTDIESETIAAPLLRINQHVKALAVIHDLLTQQAKDDADTEYIGTQEVLNKLLPLLRQTIGNRRIVSDIDDVLLTAQKAASFALLVSECVSNAIKHSSGEIEITLKQKGEKAHLEICDDGDGFPEDFDPRQAANTGLQLIESAARWDLGGDVRYDNHGLGGGRVVVTFPIAHFP